MQQIEAGGTVVGGAAFVDIGGRLHEHRRA
jgi:hypothetical protein